MDECIPIRIITNLFAYDLLSLPAYLMVTHTHPVDGNLPIKTLVARQWPIDCIATSVILCYVIASNFRV